MALSHDRPRAFICACVHLSLVSGSGETMTSRFSEKKCPMCTFKDCLIKIMLSHLCSVHSNDPRFNVMCGLEGCSSTFRAFSALYSHIRHHPSRGIVSSDKYTFQRAVALPEQYSSQNDMDVDDIDHPSYDDHCIPGELLPSRMACNNCYNLMQRNSHHIPLVMK